MPDKWLFAIGFLVAALFLGTDAFRHLTVPKPEHTLDAVHGLLAGTAVMVAGIGAKIVFRE